MEQSLSSTKLEQLRSRINDERYLDDAIQRIAMVLSRELLELSQGGKNNGRQRKRRK